MTTDRVVGGRITNRRDALGMSRDTLAAMTEVNSADLCLYEAGLKRVPADILIRLSHILEVAPSYFFVDHR